ncbi:MAG: hypothetical protein QOE00_168 [Ilumatobacteraceae bacterium]
MKRLACVALFLAVCGGAAIVRARDDAVVPYPAEEVSAALDRLSQPSVPGPLPGDPAIAVGWYGHAGSCDDARLAYQAADAPLPAGASAAVDTNGNLQVAARSAHPESSLQRLSMGVATTRSRLRRLW